MLITFEGLDGAGKSSILREVAAALRLAVGGNVAQLPDVSQAPTGRRLSEVYRADEFFGPGLADSTVLSRCLAAAADLFYFDGALIAPMVAAGLIVLKERHVDTLIAHEVPVIVRRLGWPDKAAYDWLAAIFEPLQIRPALTILVEAPPEDRDRRLRERAHAAGGEIEPLEQLANREVFRLRDEWYQFLQARDRQRWLPVSNADGELSRCAARIAAEILVRR